MGTVAVGTDAVRTDVSNILDWAAFSELDRHLARFMERQSGKEDPELTLAVLLVSYRTGQGDICLDIPAVAGSPLVDLVHQEESAPTPVVEACRLPESGEWQESLRRSRVVGAPGQYAPLVLDDRGRLYLYRYWMYERRLAESVDARLDASSRDVEGPLLSDGIDRLFPKTTTSDANRQRVAAYIAATSRFCIITGGPGTGKTSTVVRILTLMIEQGLRDGAVPQIAVTAPTGKASARLRESIERIRNDIACSEAVSRHVPEETHTIHRLLGARPDSASFRHDAEHPLPFDVVVVDECSMADCALLSKLFQAVRPAARVILLGDKDQLASVEAGGVLGDLCDTGTEHGYSAALVSRLRSDIGETVAASKTAEPAIADCIVALKRTYRFGSDSGIGALSRAVRDGDADAMRTQLAAGSADVRYVGDVRPEERVSSLAGQVLEHYQAVVKSESTEHALDLLSRLTVLCALRRGPFGLETVNRVVEAALFRAGLIDPPGRWYHGKPVMVLRNDYSLGLFNGDIGVIRQESGRFVFVCRGPEGKLHRVVPSRLPEHQSAYAMTVHKSQGSEFDRVLLLLPDKPSRVLSRELLYTAVTRARKRVEIWGTEEVLCSALANPSRRTSGLRDALWSV